ncbi:MAG: hypothetical protein R6U32_06395 [Candidatus Woesearchaeota archaeon]
MAKEMKTYLNAVTADYTATELQVTPQRTITEDGNKNQVVHEADDGTISVTTFSDDSIFTVTLQWDVLEEADANTIVDFYHDSTKANGRERTFYWHHPTDGNIYTVRFMGPLQRVWDTKIGLHRKVSQVELRVEGYK